MGIYAKNVVIWIIGGEREGSRDDSYSFCKSGYFFPENE